MSYVATAYQNGQLVGDYYDMPIPPVEYIYASHLGFFRGNVVKYITRYRNKGGKEDLLKARLYIDMLIEREYPQADFPEIDFENIE